MKAFAWLFIGISTFATCMGVMIGLSSVPVVAVFLTSIFGLFGTFLTFWKTKGIKTSSISTEKAYIGKSSNHTINNFKILGISLFLFSSLLLLGISIGIYIKLKPENKPETTFVWDERNKPKTVEEALDWILLKERLLEKGFSNKSVSELYKLKDYREPTVYSWDSLNKYSSALKEYTKLILSEFDSTYYGIGARKEDIANNGATGKHYLHERIPKSEVVNNPPNGGGYLIRTVNDFAKHQDTENLIKNDLKKKVDSLIKFNDLILNKKVDSLRNSNYIPH